MTKSVERQLDECRDALRKANYRADLNKELHANVQKHFAAAERQVGELREQLAAAQIAQRVNALDCNEAERKLDTAMALLRDIRQGVNLTPLLNRDVDEILGITSTEDKS